MISVTKYVLIITVIVLILYDIFAYHRGGVDATLSTVIYKISLDNPIIPFAAGLLCGHLFWRDQ